MLGNDILLEKKLLKEEEEEEGEFDIFDLNGFDVEDVLSGETGKITDVADYSGNVVFSIDIFGKEILLPLSENYIKEVSWDDKKNNYFYPPGYYRSLLNHLLYCLLKLGIGRWN